MRKGVIARWRDFLPVTDATPALTLGEGDTPLVAAPRLAEAIGCGELWLKFEGMNPTGSFKDRGMVMAVAKAKESGARAIVCASTGNTSASAAAYAVAAGMRCHVVIPEGKVSLGKLAQALIHGANVVRISGSFDDALKIVRNEGITSALVNSVNPFRIEGQKTAAFEIVETLGRAPDILALPVGNAGNISAYWKGFVEHDERAQSGRPMIYGAQAEGAAPFIHGAPIENPETIATAIRIGNPASWSAAQRARLESGGRIDAVSDADILVAQARLAAEAGVFCEPASAAGVASLLKIGKGGQLAGKIIVAVLTGHGLKDPQIAIDRSPPLPDAIAPNDPRLLELLT
ncbi:MAG: threonine synthase [Myxococcota bacterium]|nr:threonine synthase [Myxococcota bacterium]